MREWGHVHEWAPTTQRRKGSRVYRCTTCPAETTSRSAHGPQEGAFPWGLTRREWEMLRWFSQGRSRPWVARHMGVKHGTVNVYLWRIREKIGVGAERVGVPDHGTVVHAYHCYVNRNRDRGWRT